MFKILIWDYTGVSAQWLDQVADKQDIEVVGTITPNEPPPEILLRKNSWDWLLIFERGLRNFFDTTIQVLKLPLDRVIYALDMNSWVQHPKAAFTLANTIRGGGIFLTINFAMSQQLNSFVTCTVEGISYVATAADNMIMRQMYTARSNWAAEDMRAFHELAKKYYNVDDSAGYFLDLGANIGTTGIYFLKKFTPNLKLIAFEPDAENFKLLSVNLLLNDIANKTFAVNCGLGDKRDEMAIHRNLDNPGGNSLIENESHTATSTAKILPLDDYLAENQIAAQEVKYIWIDTEGFEPQVLIGAKNLLRENPAPIFMECNLGAWKNSGRFEEMMTLLAENYSHFMLFSSGKEILCPLDALRSFEIPNNAPGQIGDIFLIKKGAFAAE